MERDINVLLSHTTTDLLTHCMIWQKSLNSDGYPRAVIGGDGNAKVHRVVWELANESSAKGKVVRHTCDNPKCVNPNHLIIGTQFDNNQDMVERGRYNSKLNAQAVRAMRLLYESGKFTQEEVGKMFGVNHRTANSVINRKHWKHVE